VSKLTPKQRAFVEHYLQCWNATEAARRAGYSVKTANQQGPRLLVNVGIQAAVDARLDELKMGADEVLTRLASHARGSMDDFIGSMDRIDLDKARNRGVMHLARKLKQRTTTISKSQGEDVETHEIELELYDAQSALALLGRHHKLFVDRQEVSGADGNAIQVQFVNDWRSPAADAAPGAALGAPAGAALQLAGGGAALAQDVDGDEHSG
jgi:phage terminase small subunit